MLTNDKTITQPEYWNKIYEGKNDNAKVDASNLTRPANTFDRFTWVAKHAEGPNVLEIAAGHAHISKRIKAANPEWAVYASDQAESARKVARYEPYYIFNAYKIPFPDKFFTTVIACQCLEYMDRITDFLIEACRVSDYLIFTVPIGEMAKWSQLYVFTEEGIKEMLLAHSKTVADILHWERHEDLLLVKIKFENA